MDHLKFRLFNDILDSEEFKKAAYKGKYDNLFFVQGPSIISDLRYYQPRHVETIVRLAAADYDIILIDAGSNVERGLCIGALRSSPYRYAVTTQQAHVKDRFLRLADQIFLPMQIDRDTMQLIVNKHVPSNIRDKQIEEVYGAKILAEIPHLDFKGWQAEVETKTLLGQEPRYDAAVAAIAKTITERQEIPLEAESMGIRAKLGRWMR
ncbi:hypothetical protein B8V81_5064 [Paenibacillus pasadenensis]|uniref:Uncharacterized protein n=2 Tax=Paenibacillus pasadenensis TaxID=217090 RepID=A0A2N5MZK9_9BACL|nr:hypothetical protein B8V81_5064 [Paenibacillus pasadenensis]